MFEMQKEKIYADFTEWQNVTLEAEAIAYILYIFTYLINSPSWFYQENTYNLNLSNSQEVYEELPPEQ
jgi:hypothetical protein